MRFAAISASLVIAAGLASPADAQNWPRRKPGLWEIQYTIAGTGMESMADHFAKMPPAERARAEAYMKSRGIDVASNVMKMQFCLTPQDAADQGEHQLFEHLKKDGDDCQRRVTDRTSDSVRFHSACRTRDGGTSEMDGRIYDIATDHAAAEWDGKSSSGREIHMRQTSRWVAADCGAIGQAPHF